MHPTPGIAVQQPARRHKRRSLFRSLTISVLTALALFVLLNALNFNVGAFEIPGSSMEYTLLVGDHILVSAEMESIPHWMRLLPSHVIKDGDILVFRATFEPNVYQVKRVIGVPGDHLRLESGALIRNGNRVSEPYAVHQGNGGYNPFRDNFPAVFPSPTDSVTAKWKSELASYIQNDELAVPSRSYFMMGDNRDVSYDSRYWGFVPQENIIGRALIIYWSFNASPEDYLRTTPTERATNEILHFFDQTRWNRMWKVPR